MHCISTRQGNPCSHVNLEYMIKRGAVCTGRGNIYLESHALCHTRGYSGHYKGIEEGAAYCHTRSTTCPEQDEEEGQRRFQNVGKHSEKMKKNQEGPFLCFASSGLCCSSSASFAVLRWRARCKASVVWFCFGYCSVLFAAV